MRYVSDGYHLSLSGFITKKKNGAEIRSLIPKIPMKQLMIESDAPYMHLSDKRVKKLKLLEDKNVNEPVVLPLLLEAIQQCYDDPSIDMEVLSQQTTQNALDFFQCD